MGDVWVGAVATGIGALVVGVLLHLLKEGGVRRTRRRNVREELELLKLLDDHPEPAARIRKRVEVMLEQYEPPEERKLDRRRRVVSLLSFAVLVPVAAALVATLNLTSWWEIALVGTGLGFAGNVVIWAIERRKDQAEQDTAVGAWSKAAQRMVDTLADETAASQVTIEMRSRDGKSHRSAPPKNPPN